MTRATLLVAGVVALCGCSHDYDLRFRFLTEGDADVQLDSRNIQIPRDVVVAVEILALDDDEISYNFV